MVFAKDSLTRIKNYPDIYLNYGITFFVFFGTSCVLMMYGVYKVKYKPLSGLFNRLNELINILAEILYCLSICCIGFYLYHNFTYFIYHCFANYERK